jgi:hypothetical protein
MKCRDFSGSWFGMGLALLGLVSGSACRTLEQAGGGAKSSSQSSAARVAPKPPSKPTPREPLPWNDAILRALERIPEGGGYSVASVAHDALRSAVAWENGRPVIVAASAQPSFCSGATYLAFVMALAMEQRSGQLALTPDVWRKLIVEGQADGAGVWGRWNANGPGTARFFHELGIGRNFTDWNEARAGDFLKVFWNDAIGASEKGHSVIFLDRSEVNGVDTVTFWSSNQGAGYGVKRVPLQSIQRAVFSRLERPERLSGVVSLAEKDDFLAGLLSRSVTPQEAAKACGLKGL